MKNIKKAVLSVIEDIEQEKRVARVVPSYAIDVEVRARFPGRETEVRGVLNELWRDGGIEIGRTLNNIWIKTETKTNGTE